MSAYLITQRGPEIGRRYDLSSAQFTIGRGQDNDLVLGDGLVSRYHAVIRQENEGIAIIDLGSTNPVMVNDVALEAGVPHRLLHRDVLVVGSAVLSYQHQAGVSQPSTPVVPGGEARTVVGGGPSSSASRSGAAEPPTVAPRGLRPSSLPPEAPVQPPPPPPAYEPRMPLPPAAYEPAIPPPPAPYEPATVNRPAAPEPMTPGSWTPGSPLPPPPPPLTPPDLPPPLTPPDLPPLPISPEEARTVISRRPDAGPASPMQTPGRPSEPDDETPTFIRHRSPDA